MTTMRKICPKSGEKCDCPKGICNQALEAIATSLMVSTDTTASAFFCYGTTKPSNCDCPEICAENGCQILRAVGATDIEIAAASISAESQQADALEAHSLKYQACAQIMQLSSSRFALFGAYRAGGGSGIALLAIGDWGELEPHVRAYKKLADAAYARSQERTLPTKTAADYDSLFGEES